MSQHVKGLLITLAGVIIITPDSLLIRLTEAHYWTITFWRGLFSGLTLCFVLIIWKRGALLSLWKQMNWYDASAVIIYTLGNFAFVYSINTTLVAHTLVILATIPLFSALSARIFLKEKIKKITLFSIIVAFTGILIIAGGSLETEQSGNLLGDLSALLASVCIALSLTISRAKKNFEPLPALGLSGFLTAGISFLIADSLVVPPQSWLPIATMGFFVIPVSFALIMTGPKYVPIAEVALLMLIETCFGPLWVWAIIGETPGIHALIGGGLIFFTLAGSNIFQILHQKQLTHST